MLRLVVSSQLAGKKMRRGTKGRLIALLAMTALASTRVLGQTDVTIANLENAPPEQVEAYQQALVEGQAALVAFMEAFPGSPLIPAVIGALAELIGVEAAIQAALDAGVSTETVFATAAELAPGVFTTTGQLVTLPPTERTSVSGSDNDVSTGPY
jgi:hypothetical protein